MTFYYPSILIWIIGLLIFEIPSILLSNSDIKLSNLYIYKIPKYYKLSKLYLKINGALIFLFILRFIQVARTGLPIGSDEFGEAFATFGIWGHLNILLIVFTIGDIILLSKGRKYNKLLIIFIIGGSLICLLNQVKGWVLIPILGGIIVRLKTNTLTLKPKLILIVCIVGTSIFFISYYTSLVLLRDNTDTNWFWSFFIDHFIHYLTSGINGFSI